MSRIERWVGYGVLGLLVLHALFGPPLLPPKHAEAGDDIAAVLKAHEFQLVDSGGMLRATLKVLPDGMSGLALFDKDGNANASLNVLADGSSRLELTDKDGKSNAGLAVLPNGSPYLSLRDKDGR